MLAGGRVQGHAGFYRYRWGVRRDGDGVPPEVALDHPYRGLVVMMVDRGAGVEIEALDRWYRREHLPHALAGSPCAMCLSFQPVPLPDDAPAYVPRPAGLERRSLHLYFLEEDPSVAWSEGFVDHGEVVRKAGLGRVTYAAPFIPTLPGTDRYTDELW